MILKNGNFTQTRGFFRTYNELEGTDIFPDRNGVYSIFDSDTISVAAAQVRGFVLHADDHIENGGVCQIKHTVPCFGYVVREYDRPGTLKVCLVGYSIGFVIGMLVRPTKWRKLSKRIERS